MTAADVANQLVSWARRDGAVGRRTCHFISTGRLLREKP